MMEQSPADLRVTRPRRAGAVIYLHGADITSIMLQDDVLTSFTDEEIRKIHSAVSIEMQSRDGGNDESH